ncbi:MAG: monovalent cation/H(+) antiporter subunit G [Thermoplasmata archaeon]
MLEWLREPVATALLVVGVFFYFSGAVGILRLPDVYNRIHASTKTSTIGVVSILLSGLVLLGMDPVSIKALAIVLFLMLTYPVAGHLLARAAYRTGVVLTDRTLRDEYRHVLDLGEGEGVEEEAEVRDRERV